MWAQSWDNLAKELLPFPNRTKRDVTATLKKQVSLEPLLYLDGNTIFLYDFYMMACGLPVNEDEWAADICSFLKLQR